MSTCYGKEKQQHERQRTISIHVDILQIAIRFFLGGLLMRSQSH